MSPLAICGDINNKSFLYSKCYMCSGLKYVVPSISTFIKLGYRITCKSWSSEYCKIIFLNAMFIRQYWHCRKKWCVRFRISSVNVTKSTGAGLITFAEEILNGKFHLLCNVSLLTLFDFESVSSHLKYHKYICIFENIISGIQLYNKKYHQKLNHF